MPYRFTGNISLILSALREYLKNFTPVHSFLSHASSRKRASPLIMLLFVLSVHHSWGQPGAKVDLPKPEQFEKRILASEKTGDGKLNPIKRFNQNILTHYNFHFNAEIELNEVVFSANQSHKDDFTKLLSFYDHSLESTAGQESELDSVILKCNNGILLHDLRSDWVDNLYLLMGKAYFYKKELDSAAITFQYINQAFQPRSKDEIGFDKSIGSNINNTGNVFTISTPEKKGLIPRTVTHTPSRNEAILWLLRTFIEQGHMNDAGGLIEVLRRDKTLPVRLLPMLNEMQALWFYQSGQADSAAHYLEQAMDRAATIQERSRWEFLAAQLYEKTGRTRQADSLYEKTIGHTTDPVMEAYARINRINLHLGKDDSLLIQRNIDELIKMTKKAKYEDYRHILFYAAAKLETQRSQTEASIKYLRKSISFNTNDSKLKSRAFLELGDLSFNERDYATASHSYDSVTLETEEKLDSIRVADRKPILSELIFHLENVRVEDSLQKIAAMPEKDMEAYLKSLSKKLRKEKGLTEEDVAPAGSSTGATGLLPSSKDNEPVNLFAANESKGEWYFYNNNLRSQGFRQFQAKWGKRPNLDNWRRMFAVNNQLNATTVRSLESPDEEVVVQPPQPVSSKSEPVDVSIDGLRENLPLTDSLKKLSNDTIQASLLQLGLLFKDRLDMCDEGIFYFEQLLDRYPETRYQEVALVNLCLCFRLAGNQAKLKFYKDHLARNFKDSRSLLYVNDPGLAKLQEEKERSAATATYEQIYRTMIEGRFEEAFTQKKQADSTYGKSMWTPQLLYIESIYHINQRADSVAMSTLGQIKELFPASPMAAKAATLADVLKRRSEIESYLTALDIRRYPEDTLIIFAEPRMALVKDTATRVSLVDSSVAKMNQVTPAMPDTIAATVIAPPPPPAPTDQKATAYRHLSNEPHMVVLVLSKVDVVYQNEARRALIRYNGEKHSSLGLTATTVALDDQVKLIRVSSFPDAIAALKYLEEAKAASGNDIFPWLPAENYRYVPMSEHNLAFLLEQKDLDAYLKFLSKHLPGKF